MLPVHPYVEKNRYPHPDKVVCRGDSVCKSYDFINDLCREDVKVVAEKNRMFVSVSIVSESYETCEKCTRGCPAQSVPFL